MKSIHTINKNAAELLMLYHFSKYEVTWKQLGRRFSRKRRRRTIFENQLNLVEAKRLQSNYPDFPMKEITLPEDNARKSLAKVICDDLKTKGYLHADHSGKKERIKITPKGNAYLAKQAKHLDLEFITAKGWVREDMKNLRAQAGRAQQRSEGVFVDRDESAPIIKGARGDRGKQQHDR